MDTPSIVGKKLLKAGRFLTLKVIDWVDGAGVARKWETAERVGDVGAVMIVARLMPSDRYVLIRQYRPPAARYVLEFPAGLVNPGEDPAEAAVRELREETGYVAAEIRVGAAAYTSPGMSNESVVVAEVVVDENAPDNLRPETAFDPGEMIETVLVPRPALVEFYRAETAKGTAFDAKLAAFIVAKG